MAIPLKTIHPCVAPYLSAAETWLKEDSTRLDSNNTRNAMIVAYTLYGEDNPGTDVTYQLAYNNYHAGIENVDPK